MTEIFLVDEPGQSLSASRNFTPGQEAFPRSAQLRGHRAPLETPRAAGRGKAARVDPGVEGEGQGGARGSGAIPARGRLQDYRGADQPADHRGQAEAWPGGHPETG